MDGMLRRIRAFTAGAAVGLLIGYLQGSAIINVVRILGDSPVAGAAGQAAAMVEAALVSYGIWAYIGASALRGLLLLFFAPAESITPLYVLTAAETPFDVAVIAVVGAATITAFNLVIYGLSRLAGERFVSKEDSAVWRFAEWLVGVHSGLSMYLLRLVPGIGAWAAVPAGIARIRVRTFLIYSFLGFLTYEAFLGFAAYYGLDLWPMMAALLPG